MLKFSRRLSRINNVPYKPIRISSLLPPSHPIHQTMERHHRILRAVKHALPAFLREHCFDCVIKNNELLIYTDSSVWASQLRFYQIDILDAVRRSPFSIINHIHIRISAPNLPSASHLRSPRTPSKKTIEGIKAVANTSIDSQLSASLWRLAHSLERGS